MKKKTDILFLITYIGSYVLLIAGSVFGCIGCRAPKPMVNTIVKDSVVYKDSLIKVYVPPVVVPGDTVKLTEKVPCPETQWKGQSKSKSGRTQVAAEINNGTLNVECFTDSLLHVQDSLEQVITKMSRYKQEIVTISSVEYKMPWWGWLLIAVALLIALVALFK